MIKQYIISEKEVKAVKAKLKILRQAALLSRDAGEVEDNKEYYLKAKGFQEALEILGID